MWQSAADFLGRWIGDNVLAQSRCAAEIDLTVGELRSAARACGIPIADLVLAAGGDLKAHVRAAIEVWSGD